MKKRIIPVLVIIMLSLWACNNSNDKTEKKENAADSVMHEIMDGHDAVMPKMSRVRTAQKKAQQMSDSIAALPAKAREAAASFKTHLDSLVNELNYADFAMDKWMSEFNMDSAKDNMEERVKYLAQEKLKINKVKEAVMGGLAKADSLLKAKL